MASVDLSIHIRTASSAGGGAGFILAAWDSTLPFLASMGAGEMWGDQPFSQREGQEQEIIEIIRRSEENEVEDSRRFFVAELHRPDEVVKVGAAMIRDTLPTYLTEHIDLRNRLATTKSFLYLEVLVANYLPQQRYKGVGKALIDALKQRAHSRGKDAVYVDVWAKNDRKLNRQV